MTPINQKIFPSIAVNRPKIISGAISQATNTLVTGEINEIWRK